MNKTYSIIRIETINEIMIVSILKNQSHEYSNHYSIIKFVIFDPIYYYAINLIIISSFIIFNEFAYVFFTVSFNK